jgi:glycine cleavage system H protein
MEGFTYQNIFETKGIEYLLIISFFIVLIPFWIILSKRVKASRLLQRSLHTLSNRAITVPQGLFFSPFHTWAHMEKSGTARVGLDDFLIHMTGPVQLESGKLPGEWVRKGELLAKLTLNGKQLRILSPVSGEITEENPVLRQDFDQVALDPYTRGWLYKVRPTQWIAETQTCYLAENATAWISLELDRFKNWMTGSTAKPETLYPGIVLQDGGELIDHPLAELPEEAWQEFQERFLNVHQ